MGGSHNLCAGELPRSASSHFPIIASSVYSQDVLLIAAVSQEGTQREVNLEFDTSRVFNEHCSYLEFHTALNRDERSQS